MKSLASALPEDGSFATVYFGGGSPSICELTPFFNALKDRLAEDVEFTIEVHPRDVTDELLDTYLAGGVTRISMGLQSLDDEVLRSMNRGYTREEAFSAFARIKTRFANAGVDLIVGYPGDRCDDYRSLASLGMTHCSVYSLQNERNLANVPSDEWTLDRLREVAAFLESEGLVRYEISNYAREGFACRHNSAVWRGEDYLGLGEGAYGRVGRKRTRHFGTPRAEEEVVSEEQDRLEREIFALRTREGLSFERHPEWRDVLERFASEGLLVRVGSRYRLTSRGTEVCDTILTELV